METKQIISDNSPCEKCGSRTALITGTFEYTPHSEPYQEGVEEDAIASGGFCYMSALKCDSDTCGHIQYISVE
jgi:hypothetical protein